MENNNKYNNARLIGFANNGVVNNTNNDAVCFEYLFNKSLGNGKQDSNNFELNFLNELVTCGVDNNKSSDGSFLNIVNNIDNTNDKFEITNESNTTATYTLDELLDLTAVVPNEMGSAEPLFFDEPIDDGMFYPAVNKDIEQNVDLEFLELKMQSPMSSSSEESCDLDELLFELNDGYAATDAIALEEASSPAEVPVIEEVKDDIIESTINTNDLMVTDNDILAQLGFQQTELPNNNEAIADEKVDLAAICSYLFQSQQMASMEDLEPASPAESTSTVNSDVDQVQSDSDHSLNESDIRFTPYKKPKKQKTPEQKQRKKAQNRTAASRYRVKKKDELQAMTTEANELEETNKDLRTKVEGLRTEIDYLKNLMLDVIKARLSKGNITNVTNLLNQLS